MAGAYEQHRQQEQSQQRLALGHSRHKDSWCNVRKNIFKAAREKWNEKTFEMRRARAELSNKARILNATAKCKNELAMAENEVIDQQAKIFRKEVTKHQLSMFDRLAAGQQGDSGPKVLQDAPVAWGNHLLSKQCPEKRQNLILIPLEDEIQSSGAGSHQYGACGAAHASLDVGQYESACFLHKHGDGLHGIGDSEFGLSQSIVEHAMTAPGFVKQNDLQFKADHSTVCSDAAFSVNAQDDLDNIRSCQQLCGRYCRKDIRNVEGFHNAIEMIKTVARIMASRRDVRNGNTMHISPSCFLPILLIITPVGMFGRLACRVAFKPLEVDWLHCEVDDCEKNGESIYLLKIAIERLQQSMHICPVSDSMCELAVWMAETFQTGDGYECKLFTEYELDQEHDDTIILRSTHQSASSKSPGGDSFESLLWKRPSKKKHVDDSDVKIDEDSALQSLTKFFGVLKGEGNATRKRKSAPSASTEVQLFPAAAKATAKAKAKAGNRDMMAPDGTRLSSR